MTVFAMAQITITDRTAYDKYKGQFMGIFQKFSGTLLAADESPDVIEGTWDYQKVILMSFPSKQAFEAWFQSPEYQEIAKDRKAGSHGVVLLVEGVS